MIKTILKVLVPLDGSPLAEHALGTAAQLVEPERGELLLARVAVYQDLPLTTGYGPYLPEAGVISDQYERTRAEAGDYLESTARRLVTGDVHVRTIVMDGDRAGALVDCAAAEGVDLVVMTTHGRTGLTRWVMGSVTERVVRDAPCPVLALRPPPALSTAESEKRTPVRMLVALDGSELAEKALPMAVAVAARLGAQLTLLHAYAPQSSPQRRDAMSSYLEGVSRTYADAGVHITPALYDAPGGSATQVAAAILDYAETAGIGLIALTTHGRTGLERRLVGSVTERIMRATSGGLLVVRPTNGA